MARASVRWEQDAAILARLEEHQRRRRAGDAIPDICARQRITERTYWRDEQRLKEQMLRCLGEGARVLRAQATQWYRETIADADRRSMQPDISESGFVGCLAAKQRAVDAFVRLWGVDAPLPLEVTTPVRSTGETAADIVAKIMAECRESLPAFQQRVIATYGAENIHFPDPEYLLGALDAPSDDED